MSIVLKASGLTKRFGSVQALDGLDLEVPKGCVLGLLGTNGAGKTTAIRLMVGHLHPSAGEIQVFGEDPWTHSREKRRRVSYVSDTMQPPPWMTVPQILAMNVELFPQWDHPLCSELLSTFELSTGVRYSQLSHGQKRRVVLLQSLCQGAELLIMDEPAAGLDVLARRKFLDVILEHACTENRTVVLSSHLLSDLERIVDRIALIHNGRLIHEGVLEEVKAGARRMQVSGPLLRETVDRYFQVVGWREPGPSEVELTVLDFCEERMNQLQQEIGNQEIKSHPLNLEDIFVELVDAETLVTNP